MTQNKPKRKRRKASTLGKDHRARQKASKRSQNARRRTRKGLNIKRAQVSSQRANKRARKAARRAGLRQRRRDLLAQYGTSVGLMVYEFERQFRNKSVGKKPESLLRMMRDNTAKKFTSRYAPCLKTTGQIHREKRVARDKAAGLVADV